MVALYILFWFHLLFKTELLKKPLINSNNFYSAYDEVILKLSTSKYKQRHFLIAINEFAYVYSTFIIFVSM